MPQGPWGGCERPFKTLRRGFVPANLRLRPGFFFSKSAIGPHIPGPARRADPPPAATCPGLPRERFGALRPSTPTPGFLSSPFGSALRSKVLGHAHPPSPAPPLVPRPSRRPLNHTVGRPSNHVPGFFFSPRFPIAPFGRGCFQLFFFSPPLSLSCHQQPGSPPPNPVPPRWPRTGFLSRAPPRKDHPNETATRNSAHVRRNHPPGGGGGGGPYTIAGPSAKSLESFAGVPTPALDPPVGTAGNARPAGFRFLARLPFVPPGEPFRVALWPYLPGRPPLPKSP